MTNKQRQDERERERKPARKRGRKGRKRQYKVKGKNGFYEMSFELVVGVLV